MKKLRIKIGILSALLLTAAFAQPVFAQSLNLNLLPQDDKKVEQLITDRVKKKIREGTFFVFGIEEKIKRYRDELKLLKSNMTALEGKIEESKVRIEKLESQVSNLDKLIAQNKEKIYAGGLQKARLENEIYVIEKEIIQHDKNLDTQVGALDKTLTAYYLQTNLFFDVKDKTPSLLAFLSADESSGEILQQNEYLFFLQEASNNLAKDILLTQETLDNRKNELETKKEELIDLQVFLAREKRTLEEAMQSRKRLLEETKGKQAIYETLLELAKQEQEQVSVTITQLKENYEFFQKKLDEIKNNPNAVGVKDEAFEPDRTLLLSGEETLAWPVSPTAGLTAIFKDAAYQKALGVEHKGIDIRIASGSRVKAAADGVVSKVADNGFAYSYVIIAHPDKILTLYGHMSEIFVSEGEIVRQGQTIGLSGGIPGAKGAGWLTTGAHVHFEVFKDFQHVDPLEYLPLEYVPVASLPEKYLKRLTGEEEEKVKRRP